MVAVHVDFQAVVRGQSRCQVEDKAIRLVKIEDFSPGENTARPGLLHEFFELRQTAVDGPKKSLFFCTDRFLNALLSFGEVRIRHAHRLDHGRDQREQKRFLCPQEVAFQERSTKEQADDVGRVFASGCDAFVNREHASSDVVGDAADGSAFFGFEGVFDSNRFAGRFAQRTQRVDFEVAEDSLEYCGRPLQTHARVNVLLGQRTQVVGRVTNSVELRENEVPDLNRLAIVRGVVNFGAGSADSVGALGRSTRRPEVFVFVLARDPLGRNTDFVVPDLVGLVVVLVDGDRKPLGIQPEPLFVGEEFPGPVNRLGLEVVAKRKVAEHLEERVVVGRHADVADVAGADALLTGRRPSELQFADAQELVFELVHPGGREQDRLVLARHEHVARPADAVFGLEEGEVLFAKFVSFHWARREV